MSGVFSLLETALISRSRHRLRHLSREGNSRADAVLSLLDKPDRLLATVLLCNNLANVVCAMTATVMMVRAFGEGKATLTAATLLVTFLILVASEITPKILGVRHGEKVSLAAAAPLGMLIRILAPAVAFVNFFVGGILRIAGVGRGHLTASAAAVNAAELRSIVVDSRGWIPLRHREMLLNLIDLKDLTVEDVMTPLRSIEVIDFSRPPSAIERQLLTARFESLPLCDGGLDKIVGFLRLSEALRLLCRAKEIDGEKLRQIAKSPYFISAHTAAFRQMRNFREEGHDWGLVVNEYGDVRGLATIGDFADEIAGDLDDAEFARAAADQSGALIVEGTATLRALRRRHNLHFPPTRAKTLNGLILEYMGDFPDAPACVEIDGMRMELTGEPVGDESQSHPADPMRIARAIRILNPSAATATKDESESSAPKPDDST